MNVPVLEFREVMAFVAQEAREMSVHALPLEVESGNHRALGLDRHPGYKDHRAFVDDQRVEPCYPVSLGVRL